MRAMSWLRLFGALQDSAGLGSSVLYWLPGSRTGHYLRHAILMGEDRRKRSKGKSFKSCLLTFYWLK